MSGEEGGKLGSISVEPVPGDPEPGPLEPDPSGASAGAPGFEPGFTDMSDDDGPFFAWLPPEDRLWRHPSEGTPGPRAPRRSPGMVGPAGNMWAVAVIAGVIGALAASGLGVATGWWSHTTTVVRSIQSQPETPTVSLADAGNGVNWTAADDAVSPSVVGITVQGGSGPQAGSGLLLLQSGDGGGYVVTDRSLMASSLSMGYLGAIQVTFLSGHQSKGQLVGQDPLTGLAVIHVSDTDRTVPPSTGSVADLHKADPVLALGAEASPEGSVFLGSVSDEDQKVQLADGTDMDNLLTFSPPMAATAAGGPLIDEYGRVVGMTVGLQPVNAADQQLSFAVPIDEVSRVVDQIVAGHRVTHPWLGVDVAVDVPSTTAHRFGLVGGAEVNTILSGSPASSVGMRSSDIITSFDSQPVTSSGTLISLLEKCNPGQTVPITFIDGTRLVTSKVTLANEPNDAG
jgi:putative serine protease PepD